MTEPHRAAVTAVDPVPDTNVVRQELLVVRAVTEPYQVNTVVDVRLWEPLRNELRGIDREKLVRIDLDSMMRIRAWEVVAVGQANALSAPPREVLRGTLVNGWTEFIIVHNHPSGFLRPSPADHRFTKRLTTLASVMGLHFVDHLIYAGDKVRSYRHRDPQYLRPGRVDW